MPYPVGGDGTRVEEEDVGAYRVQKLAGVRHDDQRLGPPVDGGEAEEGEEGWEEKKHLIPWWRQPNQLEVRPGAVPAG